MDLALIYCIILKPLLVTTFWLMWQAYIIDGPLLRCLRHGITSIGSAFQINFRDHVTFPGHVQFCISFST